MLGVFSSKLQVKDLEGEVLQVKDLEGEQGQVAQEHLSSMHTVK